MESVLVAPLCYCLTKDNEAKGGRRLSRMGAQAAEEVAAIAVERQNQGATTEIAVYGSYQKNLAIVEVVLKLRLLQDLGLSSSSSRRIHCLKPITSTVDEAKEVLELAHKLGVDKVILVAEKRHAKRAEFIFRHIQNLYYSSYYPRLLLDTKTFSCRRFEQTIEPDDRKIIGLIKGWRSGSRFSWWLWNFLAYWYAVWQYGPLDDKTGDDEQSHN